MKIGDIVPKKEYTKYALWCNKNNAHIEYDGTEYRVVENEIVELPPQDIQPTLEERIVVLEAENEALNDTMLGIVEILDSL